MIEIPDFIICPMCKEKIKLDLVYNKKKEKIRTIKTNDITSFRIENKKHAGYVIAGNMLEVHICNHCKGIIGTSNLA